VALRGHDGIRRVPNRFDQGTAAPSAL